MEDEITQDAKAENLMEKYVSWILSQLKGTGSASRENFLAAFGSKGKLESDWARAKHAVKAMLSYLNYPMEEENGNIICPNKLIPSWFSSNTFQSNQEIAAKQHIGDLVARFLKDENLCGRMSVFLGSGSTIYHVGVKMIEYGPYPQLFATVNLPLVMSWCASEKPPNNQISIPEAVLVTNTCRFSTIQNPKWIPAMTIVGADGYYFDRANQEAKLFAMDPSVAANTSLFVRGASDSVIICVASAKLDYLGRNKGPYIDPEDARKNNLRLALVTDKRPHEEIAKAFEKAGWVIITEFKDWKRLPPITAHSKI